ncbi:GGDEF domain-containing protein [Vibrio vulnificus]|nr:GGDEF domain-containing protein [Vibrio vulnificus]
MSLLELAPLLWGKSQKKWNFAYNGEDNKLTIFFEIVPFFTHNSNSRLKLENLEINVNGNTLTTSHHDYFVSEETITIGGDIFTISVYDNTFIDVIIRNLLSRENIIIFLLANVLFISCLCFLCRVYVDANIDPLTGLLNRRTLKRRSINSNTIREITLIDLNNFKKINDNLGHDLGDKILVKFSDMICKNNNHHVIRLGGDEFLMLSQSNNGTMKETMEQIEDDFQTSFKSEIENFDFGLTYSTGTYIGNFSQCLKVFDDELYIKKRS